MHTCAIRSHLCMEIPCFFVEAVANYGKRFHCFRLLIEIAVQICMYNIVNVHMCTVDTFGILYHVISNNIITYTMI